jgi:hypothetical protein
MPAPGRVSVAGPTGQVLNGTVQPNGQFSLSGDNPVERWIGRLTATGAVDSHYFVVSQGCTEGYDATVVFD